jgi:MFS family permease
MWRTRARTYAGRVRSFTREARLLLLATACFAAFAAAQNVLGNLYFAALGFDRAFLGALVAVNQLAGGLAAFPAAMLLDRVGRRRGAIGGVLIGTLGWGISLSLRAPALMLIGQAMAGCGAVLYGLAVVPLLAQSSTARERTELFSVSEGLSRLALFGGSVLAGAAPALAAGWIGAAPSSADAYQAVLLASLALRFLGLLPLWRMHDPPPAAPAARPALRAVHYFDPRVLLRLRAPAFVYALPLLVVYFGGALINPFLNVFLRDRFGAGDAAIGAVLGSIDLATGVLTLAGPLLAQVAGRDRAVVLGALASAAGFAVIGFGPVFLPVAAAIVLRSALFNMTLPLYRALVIDATPDEEVAVVNFVLITSTNIGPTVAPAISGWVQDRAGYGPLFVAAIASNLAGAALFWLAGRAQRRTRCASVGIE